MKNFIKLASLLTALVLLVCGLVACGAGNAPASTETASTDAPESTVYKVGVIQYVSHPSLDNCYTGICEGLKAKLGDNVEIKLQTGSDAAADADCATYAAQVVAQDYDLIIAIATPAASSAFAAAEDKNTPVVFCAVSDPVAVGLVNTLEAPGYNCSGTSDVLDMDAQVNLIHAMQPDAKTIGVLYTTSEANSITQLGHLKTAAAKQGMEVNAIGIQNDSDIPAAAATLCASVDCVNNFTDNKVVNNLSVLLEAANNAGVPVYGSEVEQVKNGCLASVSIDYVALGKVTGEMAADALGGAKLETMAVKTISDATPVVNTDVLAAFNMTLPAAYSDCEKVTTNK